MLKICFTITVNNLSLPTALGVIVVTFLYGGCVIMRKFAAWNFAETTYLGKTGALPNLDLVALIKIRHGLNSCPYKYSMSSWN